MVLDGVNSAQLQYYVLHGVLAAKGILNTGTKAQKSASLQNLARRQTASLLSRRTRHLSRNEEKVRPLAHEGDLLWRAILWH
jgi:hypothetical protein